jgi:hypothetical protein
MGRLWLEIRIGDDKREEQRSVCDDMSNKSLAETKAFIYRIKSYEHADDIYPSPKVESIGSPMHIVHSSIRETVRAIANWEFQ